METTFLSITRKKSDNNQSKYSKIVDKELHIEQGPFIIEKL